MKISVNAQTFAVSWLDVLNKLPALVYISNNATKTICWCNAYMEEQTGFKLSEIKHIARQLNISFFTVEEHIKHIKTKLEVRKLSTLIALGKDMGL